jgi:hypothetical protein
MKTLSIKQPFAELILQGRKKIELRKWNTSLRGDFLIHSSLKPDDGAMKKFGFENLPCGFILGKANLVDVKKYEGESELKMDRSLHLADGNFGNYGFLLNNIERINPIPAKGNLNFWKFDLDKARI